MGSGISSEDHMFEIVKRDLIKDFYEKEYAKPRFINGIEIPEDFSDEVQLKNNITWAKKELERIQKNTKK